MSEVKDLTQEVDVSKLSDEELNEAAKGFSDFVNKKINTAVKEVQEAAARYGLEFHAMYELLPKGEVPTWNKMQWHVDVLKGAQKAMAEKEAACGESHDESEEN